MSDYSFMQSGLSGDYNPGIYFTTRSYSSIGVFSKNAIAKASRHVKLCGRNGVTKKDMEYALKYEVFDFVKETLTYLKKLIELKTPFKVKSNRKKKRRRKSEDEETDEDEDEDEELEEEETGIAEELTDAIVGDNVVPDTEVQEYSQIDPETVDVQDREFLRNYYRYAETWDTWQPETPKFTH